MPQNPFTYTHLKKLLPIIGNGLVVISLAFIAVNIWHQQAILKKLLTNLNLALSLSGSILIYALAVSAIAFSWKLILTAFGHRYPFSLISYIYGRSNISKYIPGNLFQYLQRVVLCTEYGLPKKVVLVSIVIELLFVILTAFCLSFIGFNLFYFNQIALLPGFNQLPLVIAMLVGSLTFIAVWTCLPKIKYFSELVVTSHLVWLNIFLFYTCYFILAGLAFLMLIINFQYALTLHSILFAIFMFAFAFAIGIIVPGAPAGIGIRESMIILLFAPSLGKAESLLVAVLFRLVTVLGDVLYMLVSTYWQWVMTMRNSPKPYDYLNG